MTHTRAVQAAVLEHEEALCRYAYRLAGNVEDARDAVQDTFMRLCRIQPLPQNGHLRSWLYKVCHSRVVDSRRKSRRLRPAGETLQELPAEGASPDVAAAGREQREALLACLQQLPQKQATVVRLKFQEGLRYREIADVTGLSVAQVGFNLHQALRTLRTLMGAAPAARRRQDR